VTSNNSVVTRSTATSAADADGRRETWNGGRSVDGTERHVTGRRRPYMTKQTWFIISAESRDDLTNETRSAAVTVQDWRNDNPTIPGISNNCARKIFLIFLSLKRVHIFSINQRYCTILRFFGYSVIAGHRLPPVTAGPYWEIFKILFRKDLSRHRSTSCV